MIPLVALLFLAVPANADDPDPIELARKSIEAVAANAAKAQQYAYREYKVTRDLDSNGKKTERRTETWDVIGLEGSAYRKLVMKNDMPLPPKEQMREDERLRKETELRKRRLPSSAEGGLSLSLIASRSTSAGLSSIPLDYLMENMPYFP